ncbi:MAG: hypothetical protein HY702_03360 [Gemmatimonadetes bacterium]|nr:hypothetical protein [Gemmatimonadota bacterium]
MLRYESFLEEASRRGTGDPLGLDPIIGYLALHALDRALQFGLDSIPPRHVATRVLTEALELPDGCACKRKYVALVEALRRGGSWDLVAVRLSELGEALEREGRYAEAGDVFRSLGEVHEQPGAAELCGDASYVSALLGCGRALRKQGAIDEAEGWYRKACERAHDAGLPDLEVSARVGLARLAMERGNYPKAQKILDEIHRDFVDVPLSPHARGSILHEMGVVEMQRDSANALRVLWQAYEAYEDQGDRTRALFDVAVTLCDVRAYEPSRKAFEILRRDSRDPEIELFCLKNLIRIASETADELLFRRGWSELEPRLQAASPRLRAEAWIHAAQYQRSLGREELGQRLLERAISECRTYRLNEWLLLAEKTLEEAPQVHRPTAISNPTVGLVSAAVEGLWRQKVAV